MNRFDAARGAIDPSLHLIWQNEQAADGFNACGSKLTHQRKDESMRLFISLAKLSGNNFARAKELQLEVIILGDCAYTVPSSRGEGHEPHAVEFNDVFAPSGFRCSCEATQKGIGCHAVAASLTKHRERAQRAVHAASRIEFVGVPAIAPDQHFEAALDRLAEVATLTRRDQLSVAETSRAAFLVWQAREEILRARESRLLELMSSQSKEAQAA